MLSWDKVSGVESYSINRDGAELYPWATGEITWVNDMTGDRGQSYEITARDRDGRVIAVIQTTAK
jgi:hypothetical protein